MSNKTILRLELSGDSKNRLSAVSKRAGMTQMRVASRLFEWFSKQSELMHGAVLGQYPADILPEVAELIRQRLLDSKK